jgi:hypothetical protein
MHMDGVIRFSLKSINQVQNFYLPPTLTYHDKFIVFSLKKHKNNVFFQVKYSLKCDICRQMDTKS